MSLVAWPVLIALATALGLGLRYRRSGALLALASVALALAAAEVVLRLAYPPSLRPIAYLPSAQYHHAERPSTRVYYGRVDDQDVVIRTNPDGLRSDWTRRRFAVQRDRIAVLGDSFTFGSRLRQEAVFPQVMEDLLREQLGRDDVAVLNAGEISYSPLIGRRLFDGVIAAYRPTVVLYVLDATDIGDDDKYGRELVEDHFDWTGVEVDPYYGAVAQVAHLGGVLEALARPLRRIGQALEATPRSRRHYDWHDFGVRIGQQIERSRFFIYRYPLEVTRPFFDATFSHIAALAASVERSGGRFLLVVAPRFHHWNPGECPRNWEARQYRLDEPWQFEYFRYFDERRAEASFEIFDLLPAFRATKEQPLVFPGDPHWNEAGAAFVARVLAAHLVEAGYVPAPAR